MVTLPACILLTLAPTVIIVKSPSSLVSCCLFLSSVAWYGVFLRAIAFVAFAASAQVVLLLVCMFCSAVLSMCCRFRDNTENLLVLLHTFLGIAVQA